MSLSVFDIFKIGIGPSSSHTMGPMNAARAFVESLAARGLLERTDQVSAQLYGSLALTGRGHCTDRAVLLGLEGLAPDTIDPAVIEPTLQRIRTTARINLLGRHEIAFDEPLNLLFHIDQVLPGHTNGMRFTAQDAELNVLAREEYYSIGGGFVVQAGAATNSAATRAWYTAAEIRERLMRIWQVMQDCVRRGFEAQGLLPGVLGVRRRAPKLYRQLMSDTMSPMHALDWVNVFALAVNEENAAGGQVVTAPTNGAAGIVPAVLHYYRRFEPGADDDGVMRFLLTAAAMGMLYKQNASISGAEMGCQGEVGVACSMAAAGLVSALNGSNEQIENAAEIGMEHNLGLTCDPVAGLVQIPCIERNAMGSVKAINAARLALRGDGSHKVSLDQVIATMRQTGLDMSTIYKETSQGGLAVNVPEC
jgi:L-serine dehydratase